MLLFVPKLRVFSYSSSSSSSSSSRSTPLPALEPTQAHPAEYNAPGWSPATATTAAATATVATAATAATTTIAATTVTAAAAATPAAATAALPADARSTGHAGEWVLILHPYPPSFTTSRCCPPAWCLPPLSVRSTPLRRPEWEGQQAWPALGEGFPGPSPSCPNKPCCHRDKWWHLRATWYCVLVLV